MNNIEILAENTGEILQDFFTQRFLGKAPRRSTGNRAKTDKWDYMKLASFWTAKEALKVNGQ